MLLTRWLKCLNSKKVLGWMHRVWLYSLAIKHGLAGKSPDDMFYVLLFSHYNTMMGEFLLRCLTTQRYIHQYSINSPFYCIHTPIIISLISHWYSIIFPLSLCYHDFVRSWSHHKTIKCFWLPSHNIIMMSIDIPLLLDNPPLIIIN